MTEYTKQYAIRLPNGQLHAHQPGGYVISGGIISYVQDEEAIAEPVVYDTLEEAQAGIERFQAQAAHMGITEWLGHIETRHCTPFSHTEPSADMLSDLESWLRTDESS